MVDGAVAYARRSSLHFEYTNINIACYLSAGWRSVGRLKVQCAIARLNWQAPEEVEVPDTAPDKQQDQSGRLRKTDHAGLVAIACLAMAHKFPIDLSLTYLPAILRKNGIDLTDLSGLSLILIPFWFRWAWSPLVDHNGSERIGHRKSWILPCTVIAFAVYVLIGQIEPTPENLPVLIGMFAVASLVMATQQVASDAYIVENIPAEDRRTGSAYIELGKSASAVAIAIGLMSIYDRYGWGVTMPTAAFLFLILTAPVILRKEGSRPAELTKRFEEGNVAQFGMIRRDPRRFAAAFVHPFKDFIVRKETGLLVGTIILMSANLKMAQVAMPLFLVDLGFSLTEVGIMLGIGAAGGSIIGALIAAALLQRVSMERSAYICIVFMLIAYIPWLFLTFLKIKSFLVAVLCLGCLGMLATPTQVLVMAHRFRWASRAQAGTDFTFQTSAEFIGYSIGAAVAGPLVATVGYGFHYVTSLALSLIGIVILIRTHGFIDRCIAARNSGFAPAQPEGLAKPATP